MKIKVRIPYSPFEQEWSIKNAGWCVKGDKGCIHAKNSKTPIKCSVYEIELGGTTENIPRPNICTGEIEIDPPNADYCLYEGKACKRFYRSDEGYNSCSLFDYCHFSCTEDKHPRPMGCCERQISMEEDND